MHAVASQDAIFSQRSELKFLVDESKAIAIRQYLLMHLRPDPNSSETGYPVCSVYMDSPDDVLYHQTNQGIRNRYKLRVRIYDNEESNPAFLEIKRREGSAVKKQRATVDRATARALLSGENPSVSLSQSNGPVSAGDWKAFQEFTRLRDRIGAIGTTYVYYQREAFVSPQNSSSRATFDRQLIAHPYTCGSDLALPVEGAKTKAHDTVVFELKFTNRFPQWMQKMVRVFDLVAGPFPKYVTCRDTIERADTRHLE